MMFVLVLSLAATVRQDAIDAEAIADIRGQKWPFPRLGSMASLTQHFDGQHALIRSGWVDDYLLQVRWRGWTDPDRSGWLADLRRNILRDKARFARLSQMSDLFDVAYEASTVKDKEIVLAEAAKIRRWTVEGHFSLRQRWWSILIAHRWPGEDLNQPGFNQQMAKEVAKTFQLTAAELADRLGVLDLCLSRMIAGYDDALYYLFSR